MNLQLLSTYAGQDVTGWLVSEKLDGWRARWDGSRLLTRSGSIIEAPDWFLDGLPDGVELDGELYAGRGKRGLVQTACQRRCPVDAEWHQIEFAAFDVPLPLVFQTRWEYLDEHMSGIPVVWFVIPHVRVESMHYARGFYQAILKQSGEGVVFRDPAEFYTPGRAKGSLKCKPGEGGELL